MLATDVLLLCARDLRVAVGHRLRHDERHVCEQRHAHSVPPRRAQGCVDGESTLSRRLSAVSPPGAKSGTTTVASTSQRQATVPAVRSAPCGGNPLLFCESPSATPAVDLGNRGVLDDRHVHGPRFADAVT